ncbi:MAG: ABC transporter permease [Desulfobacteraceae bacterium]|nr:MAG: ABC transporter permease [Desulfobacteraceae bacterium]
MGIKEKILPQVIKVTTILTVVIGLTLLILWLGGAPPLRTLFYLWQGSLGSWSKVSQVVTAWIPLVLCCCGLLFSFRIGLWNIGVEGQIMAGAIFATAVLRLGLNGADPVMMIGSAFMAGILGGALWAIMAGLLKTKAGVNEIFSGLGMNFVAMGVSLWLIFGPWKREGIASMSGTEPFPNTLWLSTVFNVRLSHWGLLLVLAGLIVTVLILGRTHLGLALKAIGNNPRAALLHGLKPNRYMLYAIGLAGGFAGVAGAFQVVGVYHRLIPSISSNYGYLALLVVMLADYRVWSTPILAFFFACLNVGSIQLPMMLQLDSSLSGIIQGVVLLATLFVYGWQKKKRMKAE